MIANSILNSFEHVSLLCTQSHTHKYLDFDWILGASNQPLITHSIEDAINKNNSWKFGYLGYDLKNDFEQLRSRNTSILEIPKMGWFEAEVVIGIKKDQYQIIFQKSDLSIKDIVKGCPLGPMEKAKQQTKFHPTLSKEEYLDKIRSLQNQIQLGNIYEVNFCQEFIAEQAEIDPLALFLELNKHYPTPFASFLKLNDFYSIGNSPERFLGRNGNKLISQPIKGTIKRGDTEAEDKNLQQQLLNDQKERSENIMIVDLVRNDLSRTAKPGSVKVEELCKLYTFPLWHQLISTVVSEVPEGTSNAEIIRTTFPMGSMTGAPKISAMKLIDEHENFKRGIYSGSIGFVDPEGDFDLNVVIRTFNYDKKKKVASYPVGGAITAKSIPEKEYEECLVKAQLIHKLFP